MASNLLKTLSSTFTDEHWIALHLPTEHSPRLPWRGFHCFPFWVSNLFKSTPRLRELAPCCGVALGSASLFAIDALMPTHADQQIVVNAASEKSRRPFSFISWAEANGPRCRCGGWFPSQAHIINNIRSNIEPRNPLFTPGLLFPLGQSRTSSLTTASPSSSISN